MKTFASLGLICFLSACFLKCAVDGTSLGNGPIPLMAIKFLEGTLIDVPMNVVNPPQNKNDSLGYRVYTQRNPNQPCFFEPTQEALKRCQINPNDPLILLVHGFVTTLNPGNLFDVMKDKILANGPYTVIILDWTKYNGPPVSLAVINSYKIGPLAAEVLKFIEKNVGVKAENMRVTGHSLGAHMSGYIGRNVPNLGRIDALDPPGFFYTTISILSKLRTTDAKFVRVIHCTNEKTFLGTTVPLGHFDFYVNGGEMQPHCQFGERYTRASGDVVTINSLALKVICPHELSISYYIDSINNTDCQFLATNCDSYRDFKNGECPPETSAVANMGFYGNETPVGLPEKSKFYLRTSKNMPFCLQNGYKPLKSWDFKTKN